MHKPPNSTIEIMKSYNVITEGTEDFLPLAHMIEVAENFRHPTCRELISGHLHKLEVQRIYNIMNLDYNQWCNTKLSFFCLSKHFVTSRKI